MQALLKSTTEVIRDGTTEGMIKCRRIGHEPDCIPGQSPSWVQLEVHADLCPKGKYWQEEDGGGGGGGGGPPGG